MRVKESHCKRGGRGGGIKYMRVDQGGLTICQYMKRMYDGFSTVNSIYSCRIYPLMSDTVKHYFPSRILHAQGLFRVQDISLE